jgi:hypothetical protein
MPLLEVEGNGEIEAPLQKGPTAEKVGIVGGVIVIVRCKELAHCPEAGVNV